MSSGEPIQFGIRIPPCTRIDTVSDAVARAEQKGFDVAWIADSQLLWRDVYATMALAARETERISLATAVTNYRTRHPSVIASAINTVAELAPGRVELGIGSGDSSVKPLAMKPNTRAQMRESIELTRRLLDGEMLDFGDRTSRLRDATGRVPVHLAASGPRTFELGGEVADGVVTLAGISPELLKQTRDAVHRGCATAGRDPDDITFTVGAFCRVTDNVERDAASLKPMCFHLASIGAQESLARAGIELEAPPYVPAVYPDMVHAEDWDLAVRHAAEYVTDEMAVKFAQEFCLFGSVDEILTRIGRAVELGVTGFYLRHVGNYTLPHELIESFGDEILPRVAAAKPGASR